MLVKLDFLELLSLFIIVSAILLPALIEGCFGCGSTSLSDHLCEEAFFSEHIQAVELTWMNQIETVQSEDMSE